MTSTNDDDAPTEVEWQFDALDLRPVERWLAALPQRPATPDLPTLTALAKPTRRLVDHYVDTEDWRLGQAGFVLRTRKRGRQVEATIKDRAPASDTGLRQRLEVTETINSSSLDGLGSAGPVGRRIAAVAGRHPLREVLEVRTRRQPFSLRAAGLEVAEVALDDTTIIVGAGERPVQLRRVEVEVVAEWVDVLGPLVEELRSATGLAPATLSKFEAGLLAAGLEIPGAPDLGPTAVVPGTSIGDLAFAVTRKHLGVLLAHEPGTRLGDDIEELHDMRVATRRLRAAFEVFSAAMPVRTQTLRAELKWLADALGAVRDLDVQLERMGEMQEWADGFVGADHEAPLEHLQALLEAQRDDARVDLLDALDSPRWDRLRTGLIALARQGPNRRLVETRIPAAVAVPPLVAERHHKVVKAAKRAKRTGVATDFHQLRIKCKRLRYSLEFTSGLYGKGTQRFVAKLTGLQDALGLMQDAEVASHLLYALATGTGTIAGAPSTPEQGPSLPPETVFVMGAVAQHYRTESDELHRTMAKRLGFVTGGAWDELVSVMARARTKAEATAAVTSRPVRRTAVPAVAVPAAMPASIAAAEAAPLTDIVAAPAALTVGQPVNDPDEVAVDVAAVDIVDAPDPEAQVADDAGTSSSTVGPDGGATGGASSVSSNGDSPPEPR